MKKILLYGFVPYANYSENISEEIIRAFPKQKGISTKIFDIKFSKAMFLKAINRAKPDMIIGLGQHPRARKIRIEKKAVNVFVEKKGAKRKEITKRGTPSYFLSPTKKIKGTTITYNAGTYLCNYSMYVVAEFCSKKQIPCYFLHLPKNTKQRDAERVVSELIRNQSK